MRWLLLLLLLRSSLGELQQESHSKRDVNAMMNMPQITDLDVDCGQTGMTVKAQFSQPFNGVIYSKGHFNDPSCRYVEPTSNQASYIFKIPSSGCGTQVGDVSETKSTISSTIIFQMDHDVQEIWDTAKKLSCVWTSRFPKKEIKFTPFEVSMLEVVSMNYEGDEINCWMEIQKGVYPETSAITGNVDIGDEISLMIFLQDTEDKADIGVRDCWAFAGDNFQDETAPRVQLTSSTGCILRPKLIGQWQKTRTVINSRDTLVAHAPVATFKFPDQSQIHLMCNAEVCYGQCKQCEDDTTLPHVTGSDKEVVGVEDVETPQQDITPPSNFVDEESEISRGEDDSVHILEINKMFPTINVEDIQEEERVSQVEEEILQDNAVETSEPVDNQDDENISQQIQPSLPVAVNQNENLEIVYTDDVDNEGPHSGVPILNCFPGDGNIICQKIFVTDRPEIVIDGCSPGSSDPRCLFTLFREIDCTKQSYHPQCLSSLNLPSTDDSSDGSLDDCTEGSLNPNCLTPTKEIDCAINADDELCQILHDITPKTEASQNLCSVNSNDPNCLNEITENEISPLPSCSVDSNNPECLNAISQNEVTSASQCKEGNDSSCTSEPETVLDEQNICVLQPEHPLCITETDDTPANVSCTGSENHDCSDISSKLDACDSASNPECNTVTESHTDVTGVIDCSENPTDVGCQSESQTEIDCNIQSENPHCIDSITAKESNPNNVECQGDAVDINCISQSTDFQCEPNSNDPQCQVQQDDTPVEDFIECTENSSNPICLQGTSNVYCNLYPDNPLCQRTNSNPNENKEENLNCDENSIDSRCQQNDSEEKNKNIPCNPFSKDSNCQENLPQELCFPGSKDPSCRFYRFSSDSESSESQESVERRPRPTRLQMNKNDDFHGDKDPRYHAFHSYLYEPPPRPRPRGKRSFAIPSETVHRNPKFRNIEGLLNRSRTVHNNSTDSVNQLVDSDKYKSKEYILSVNTVFKKLPGNEEDSYDVIKQKLDISEYRKAHRQLLVFILSFCCIFSFFILINFYLCKVQGENRSFNV